MLLTLALCVLLKMAGEDLYSNTAAWLGPMLALLVPLIAVVVMLGQQPKADVSELSFTVSTVEKGVCEECTRTRVIGKAAAAAAAAAGAATTDHRSL